MEILTAVSIIAALVLGALAYKAYQANARNAKDLAESRVVQARLSERIEGYDSLEVRFSDAFKALSSDTLRAQSESFSSTAEQSLRAREEAVDNLVRPLSEQIGKLDRVLAEREGALGSQIEALKQASSEVASEANKLSSALTGSPHASGSWGEMQVKRALELSGLTEGIGYTTQDADGQGGRPDFIVHLPNERQVIIDSKVSLVAYLRASEAADDEERIRHLGDHAMAVRRHVEDLSSRRYSQNLPSTPDFVVMAIPDFALLPAVQQDPDLIDRALQRDVVLATFSTLVALLRCIDRGWQERRSIDQVREIIECGQILHDRLRVFAGHFEDVGKELGQAVNKYNEGVGSFNSRLLVQAQRFSKLGVPTTRELPNLRTIEASIQPLRDYSSEAEEE